MHNPFVRAVISRSASPGLQFVHSKEAPQHVGPKSTGNPLWRKSGVKPVEGEGGAKGADGVAVEVLPPLGMRLVTLRNRDNAEATATV